MIITMMIKISAIIKELIKKIKNKISGNSIEINILYLKLITFLPFISILLNLTKVIRFSMLTAKEIEEIRDYLNKSENPLFLYDDDPDGLCSYVLLKKYIDRGKGIIIKGAQLLEEKWVKKVEEYSPDLVVILDKPIVSQEFIDKINVPILWIDHHPIVKRKGIHHYNPRYHDENDNSPTTFLAYQIVKQNLWIAMVGCTADWYIPDFAEDR